MNILENPYMAGDPVGKLTSFVGREDVLREVMRIMRHPQQNAITLFGQRRVGKTSILQYLEAHLPDEGGYRPIYFDLMNFGGEPLDSLLRGLAQTIASTLSLPQPDLGENARAAFRDSWLPDVLATLPADESLVLLMDEFDVQADPKADKEIKKTFFAYMRRLRRLQPKRLKFIFVLGRTIDDLDIVAKGLFKNLPQKRVSMLTRRDAELLITLSEQEGGLRWTDGAVERVWALSGGHPYLTQALCSEIWELAYEESDIPPPVDPAQVDEAVDEAMQRSEHMFDWMWSGLGSAEKVAAAALASEGAVVVDEERLENILAESGVGIVISQLRNAPLQLQQWDILEAVDGGYRFRVELLRRWIAENKPLDRTQDEMDRINPVADNLYHAGQGYFEGNDLDEAKRLLQQASRLNPDHLGALELLGEIYLAQDNFDDAQKVLEELGERSLGRARARLKQIYLKRAESVKSDSERLEWYKKILEIQPNDANALRSKQAIEKAEWEQYLQTERDEIARLEQEQQFASALERAQALEKECPDCEFLVELLKRLKRKTRLGGWYESALNALQSKNRKTAIPPLQEIIALEPEYREGEAAAALYQAVSGESISKIKQEMLNTKEKAEAEQTFLKKELQLMQQSVHGHQTRGKWLMVLLGFALFITFSIALQQPARRMLQSIVSTPAPTNTSAPTNTLPSVPSKGSVWQPVPTDGMVMAYIPAGTFQMGSEDGQDDEKPIHAVTLDAFWMDQHEVTNGMYQRCVTAGQCDPPSNRDKFDDGTYTEHPVVYVSWDDAEAYCKWTGGRLPTGAEWEYAARGGRQGMTYPWGNDAPLCTTEARNGAQYNACDGNAVPVKSFAANGYDLYDMAGNVWEWTADWYDSDYYTVSPQENPQGAATGTYRVLRGGSWNNMEYGMSVSLRNWVSPSYSRSSIGFRCARSS